MGSLNKIIGMLPGVPKELRNAEIDDKELGRVEAMIRSMTVEERRNPGLINGSRRLRIANGSGTSTSGVNALLGEVREMQKVMKGLMPGGVKRKPKKGNKKGKGGGRVTPKGGAKAVAPAPPRPELKLPGLN